jgi:8-oxo-dGTP pyrophosphatase MutT (NUDIX family)
VIPVADPGAVQQRLATEYVPLWITGEVLGHVRHDVAAALHDAAEIEFCAGALRLRDAGASRSRRNQLLQALAIRLRQLGLIADWRNELCAVLGRDAAEVARCERGAFRTLGMQNRAVHVNGYSADGRIWVARRSQAKRADPGMLDNLAAGGVTAGETLRACAVRELWEEAGVPRRLALRAEFPDAPMRSLRETRFGLHDELVIVAEIELPPQFVPLGRDGEVEQFLCMSRAEVAAALERGEFTVEAALAMREFLARRWPAGAA